MHCRIAGSISELGWFSFGAASSSASDRGSRKPTPLQSQRSARSGMPPPADQRAEAAPAGATSRTRPRRPGHSPQSRTWCTRSGPPARPRASRSEARGRRVTPLECRARGSGAGRPFDRYKLTGLGVQYNGEIAGLRKGVTPDASRRYVHRVDIPPERVHKTRCSGHIMGSHPNRGTRRRDWEDKVVMRQAPPREQYACR